MDFGLPATIEPKLLAASLDELTNPESAIQSVFCNVHETKDL